MTRLLAVDPGGTSGWAETTLEDPVRDLVWGQEAPTDMAVRLRRYCSAPASDNDILVMERFTITAKTGKLTAQHDALELIGLGRYLAEWHSVTFELQAPGDAKAFATNEQLKKWGCWVPVQDHARDAVRHALYALARRRVFLLE